MKKILWWSAMLVWGVAVCGFTACSDNDSDGGSGGTVPDPEGTIVLQMPNDGSSYSLTYYIQLRLDAMNNFRIIGGSIMSVGKVAGLGAIRNIPSGAKWGNSTVATPGYGYIMSPGDDSYVRLYVESYITSSGGTIIGAKVKYELGWTPENQ